MSAERAEKRGASPEQAIIRTAKRRLIKESKLQTAQEAKAS
jgi:hypothetical protein